MAAVAVAVEAVARLGLVVLSLTGIRYEPVDPTVLPQRTRLALEAWVSADTGYVMYDRELGWAIRPSAVYRGRYHATATGLRAPLPSYPRAAAYGDSFTHGDEVEDAQTWPALLGAVNLGVPGYGLDQAYLRYLRERGSHDTPLVLLGYLSENVNRHVTVFRPFYYPDWLPFAKPRFALEADTLRLVPNPLRSRAAYDTLLRRPDRMLPVLGRDDFFWHARGRRAAPWDVLGIVRLVRLAPRLGISYPEDYDPRSESFRLTVALFERFVHAVRQDGRTPVVLLFPTWADLIRPKYLELRDTLTARGHLVLDLREAFADCGQCPELFSPGGHYNPDGNRRVAEYLRRSLP